MRLDIFLSESKLVTSRTKAQELIKTNNVKVDGNICVDVKKEVSSQNIIEIIKNIKYVGRGGEKLECAVKEFNIKVENKICLDIGSSTGGFTQVLLENKAKQVFSIDVGSDQFDKSLLGKYNKKTEREDEYKIKLFEKTDIRNFNFKKDFDLVVCDVSFISLTKIVNNIFVLLKEGGEGVILIKPQFEVEKKDLSRGGILKDENKKLEVIKNIKKAFIENTLKVIKIIPSPITGGDGNQEFLMHIKK